MKFFCALLLVFNLSQTQGQSLHKTVTLDLTNVKFEIVHKKLREQGVKLNYASNVTDIIGIVSVKVYNKSVQEVLDLCLKGKPLEYEEKDNVIIIYKKEQKAVPAVVVKKEKSQVTVPDDRSELLSDTPAPMVSVLDEVLVRAYGCTNRRTNTGTIDKIPGIVIKNHRTSDLPALLSGRVTRLLVTQTNGLPESYFKTQLDGQSAIGPIKGGLPFTDPLFVVDGIPYASNNNSLLISGSGTALGSYGRNPMIFINPDNVDHIEVLKDADATAIYGSRGARGAILITTKQGVKGKLKATAEVRFGSSRPTRLPHMLNTEQYLQMRNEALANDGVSSSLPTDIDLLLYDTTWYLDLKSELLGKPAKSKDVLYSFSGGKYNFRYYFGANFHEETTVYPGSLGCNRSDLFLHLNYTTPDGKLATSLTGNYSNDNYSLISADLTQYLLWPPNSPRLLTAENKINWGAPNMKYPNPGAILYQNYFSQTEYSLVSFSCNYRLSKKWSLKTTLGHNSVSSSDRSIKPIASINPYAGGLITGSASFGINGFKSFIAEPLVEYSDYIGRGQFTLLGGYSRQRISNEKSKINASGYKNDGNYYNTNGATTVKTADSLKSVYNYQALFGRVGYNWENKYIINLNGRMDWSDRDGFNRLRKITAAIGTAWVFSSEPFFKKLSLISFGKLRTSYGITGNDPLGNMQYFIAGRRNNNNYMAQLANSELSTELTRKLNIGIDLAFLHDRIFLSTNWFNNRSHNLVVSPDTSARLTNSPVKIQNTGFDFALQYQSNPKKKLSWSIEGTLTIPSNKLVSFPDLDNSPYADVFLAGKSLTVQNGYHFLGVDPITGLFRFQDKNNDGRIDYQDMEPIGNLDVKAYGGLQFDLSYKNWHFGFFMEGRVQTGYNYLNSILSDKTPGIAMINQPVEVLDRWRKPGDQKTFQAFTTGANTAVMKANSIFMQSDGRYANASFLRVKNIYLSTDLPKRWLKKLHLDQGNIYFQTNNTFTITKYPVLDPETQTFTTLPPLKTFLVGLKFGF